MADIQAVPELVACCGLYCGTCRSYLKGKCPGCRDNAKATWCKVRSCCIEKGIRTCAECADHPDPKDCRKFNNPVSKLFGILFHSDRAAYIAQIHQAGIDGHARIMAQKKLPKS